MGLESGPYSSSSINPPAAVSFNAGANPPEETGGGLMAVLLALGALLMGGGGDDSAPEAEGEGFGGVSAFLTALGGVFTAANFSSRPDALSSNGRSPVSHPLTLEEAHERLIATLIKPESGGNCNIAFGGRTPMIHGKIASQCTVDEVIAWQKSASKPVINGKTGTNAIGKGQFMPDTLAGLKTDLGLTGREIFDETLQNKMIYHLARTRGGLDDFLAGKIGETECMRRLSMIWAGLPKNMLNQSYYGGVGANPHKAGLGAQTLVTALREFKDSLTGNAFRDGSSTPTMLAFNPSTTPS